jgi:hypothetical protein
MTDQGYKLLEVRLVRQLPGIEDLFPSHFKISHKDLVRFTQQLAIMVRGAEVSSGRWSCWKRRPATGCCVVF